MPQPRIHERKMALRACLILRFVRQALQRPLRIEERQSRRFTVAFERQRLPTQQDRRNAQVVFAVEQPRRSVRDCQQRGIGLALCHRDMKSFQRNRTLRIVAGRNRRQRAARAREVALHAQGCDLKGLCQDVVRIQG